MAWSWLEETVADERATEANWWPPGTANSIGATYFHVIINADLELSWWLFDRAPVADTIGWPYDLEHYDRWVRHADRDATSTSCTASTTSTSTEARSPC